MSQSASISTARQLSCVVSGAGPLRMILDEPKAVAHRVDRSTVLERLAHLTEAVEGALSTLARRPTPEAVHEARISVRRLQASLSNMKHQLPSRERKDCIVALAAIMEECSAVRDADVCSRLVRHWLIRSGLKDHEQARLLRETAESERTEARRELRRRIHAPKWDKCLWKLRQHEIALLRSDGKDFPAELIGNACERYRKALRDLPKAMRKRRQLHRLRLRIKDARYFIEDFGPLLGAAQKGDLVRLRGLQKTLGDLHDEWRLRQWLRGQYKCYLVTGNMLARLKSHERQLLKCIPADFAQGDLPPPFILGAKNQAELRKLSRTRALLYRRSAVRRRRTALRRQE